MSTHGHVRLILLITITVALQCILSIIFFSIAYSDIVQTKKSSVDASASDDYINNHTETNSEYRNAAEADHPDPEDVNIEMNAENETNSQAGKQETTTVVNVTGFDTIILQKCTK